MKYRKKEEVLAYLKDSLENDDIIIHKVKVNGHFRSSYVAQVE